MCEKGLRNAKGEVDSSFDQTLFDNFVTCSSCQYSFSTGEATSFLQGECNSCPSCGSSQVYFFYDNPSPAERTSEQCEQLIEYMHFLALAWWKSKVLNSYILYCTRCNDRIHSKEGYCYPPGNQVVCICKKCVREYIHPENVFNEFGVFAVRRGNYIVTNKDIYRTNLKREAQHYSRQHKLDPFRTFSVASAYDEKTS